MHTERHPLLRALGQTIAERRKLLHESQDTFGRRVGLHRTYVGALERGEKNASLLTLAVVATGLGVPIAALITDAEGLDATGSRAGQPTGPMKLADRLRSLIY